MGGEKVRIRRANEGVGEWAVEGQRNRRRNPETGPGLTNWLRYHFILFNDLML